MHSLFLVLIPQRSCWQPTGKGQIENHLPGSAERDEQAYAKTIFPGNFPLDPAGCPLGFLQPSAEGGEQEC